MKTSHSLRGQALILEPITNDDNTVQPLIDSVSPLILRQHSTTQTGPMLVIQDPLGNTIGGFDSGGAVAGGSLTGAVILAPNTPTRNTVQPTADANKGLSIKGFSPTQSAPLLEALNSASTLVGGIEAGSGGFLGGWFSEVRRSGQNVMMYAKTIDTVRQGLWMEAPNNGGVFINCVTTGKSGSTLTVAPPGNGSLLGMISFNPTDEIIIVGKAPSQSTNSLDIYVPSGAFPSVFLIDQNERVIWGGVSDAGNGRNRAIFEPQWVSSVDAMWKGRLVAKAVDFNAEREVYRIEADGTAGRHSWFGAPAVVQQANASQATINAVTDANAKAALQSIYNLLKNYALAPATA